MEDNTDSTKNTNGKCPFGFDDQKHTKMGVQSNSKWWPNQLNLLLD